MGIILEERIERVLRAKELELDGNAYMGKYELNNVKSIIKFISSKLRLNNEGENVSYTNLDTGNKIIISKRAAEKLATHYRSGEIYQKTLVHIPKIIEVMQFLDEMKPDKVNSKFGKYSYYITKVKIDDQQCIILSTIGNLGREIYYDQNVFIGSINEVFRKAKNETLDLKYNRLNEILRNLKESDWSKTEIKPSGTPTASTNKYSKFSEEKQDLSKNFLQI
jgi:hypothetical protein